jgi:hypothetical protein
VRLARAGQVTRLQRVGVPLFSPAAMLRGDSDRMVDVTPLYAGASTGRMHEILSAGAALRSLAP